MSKSTFAHEKLRSLVARVERLEEEKRALQADIREVYAEAKGHGFDTKIMRKAISRRAMDQAQLQEQDALLDLYLDALLAAKAPPARTDNVVPMVAAAE